MAADRTLLITGGTGGLGTTVVSRLLRDHHCVVLYHGESPYAALRESVPSPDRLHGIQVDLTNEEGVRAAIGRVAERWGAPYGVVHLVGGFALAPLADTTWETWERMLSLNTTSAFLVLREALRVMRRGTPGRIVAIGARSAAMRTTGMAAYVASKAALGALVEVAAAELAGTGITVNALLPGALDTPANRRETSPAGLVPLESVSESIAWLVSDAAAHVTGSLIPVTA